MVEILLLILRISPLLLGPAFFIAGGATAQYVQIKLLFVLLALILGWESLYTGTAGLRDTKRNKKVPVLFIIVGLSLSFVMLNLLRVYISTADFYLLIVGIGATIFGRKMAEINYLVFSSALFVVSYSSLATLSLDAFSTGWQWQFLPIAICYGALAAGTELYASNSKPSERKKRIISFLVTLGPVVFAELVFSGQLPRSYFLILGLVVLAPALIHLAERSKFGSRGLIFLLPFSFVLLLCTIRAVV